jgi:SAM-dependent methyltransferase
MKNLNRTQQIPREMDAEDPIQFNRSAWDRMALAGDKFYRAVTSEQLDAARKGQWSIRVTPQKPVPKSWLNPLAGRRVLCLAAAGGYQAPVLAASGADVTVFDISEEQLRRDREIAKRESLRIETCQGDMSNLAIFSDASFDLIVNPCSVCFLPSLESVWKECYRVLRPGGSLISGWINPIYYIFDAIPMDRGSLVVRHSIPYSDFDMPEEERRITLGPDRPREFGHSLEALLGGQIEAGLSIAGFFEDGWGQRDKLSSLIDVFVATRSTKLDG